MAERLFDGKTAEDVLRFLGGIQFPAKKDDLVHAARRNGAPNDIVASLERLPAHELKSEQHLLDAYPHEGE